MILYYQNKRFCFAEFTDDGNEHSYMWSITDFYKDFPFLPQLDLTEINSINFEDDRPLYLIVYREALNKEAVCGKSPDVHKFFQAIENNKQTIKNRVYELISANQKKLEPARDIVAEFDEYKAEVQSIINNLNNEISTLKNDISVLKASK